MNPLFCETVRGYRELVECLEVRNRCPKLLTRPLLPEAATEHALRAVPNDSRARRWKPHPESQWELLYSCSRGQIDWSSPAGVALPALLSALANVTALLQFIARHEPICSTEQCCAICRN